MERIERDNIIEKNSNHYKKTKIAINADISGYGKTLSMIGLIARDIMEWDLDAPFIFETIESEGKGRIRNYFISRFDKLPTTLILCSNSIIGQWEKELEHTNLRTYIVRNLKDLERIKAQDCDVIVVTPTHYNKLAIMYEKYAWKRFIFDEPGHLKVPYMRPLHAGFFWLVTATPDLILPQYKFCKNNFMRDILSNMYDPENFISDLIIRNSPDFIKSSFKMPKVEYIVHKCFQPFYNNIQSLVSPHIRLMIEAGNIEDVIMTLGGSKTSNVFELIKEKKEKELSEIEAKIKICIENNDSNTDKWINKKERILTTISEIDEKYENMLSSDCIICSESLLSPVLEPHCQNMFCGSCLLQWLKTKNTCPYCRTIIDTKNLVYIDDCKSDKPEVKREKEVRMTKIEKIIDIVHSNKDGRFLIFSDYDNTFNPIYQALIENKINFVQVKGSIKNREKNINAFKDGEVPVIFLNSTIDGSGINLTESTDIILCHYMEKSKEQQILGRALRIGRNIPLRVHYMQILE